SSHAELREMLFHAFRTGGPVAIRFPRSGAPGQPETGSGFEARRLTAGIDVCVISIGTTLGAAVEARDLLRDVGIECSVWDARSVRPVDSNRIASAATHRAVVTIEDGVRDGGAGEEIARALRRRRFDVPVMSL